MTASGHDEARALALYLWNVRLGEAFHLPIQAVEVASRNRISRALSSAFGVDWWDDCRFLAMLDTHRKEDIDEARRRVTSKRLPLVTGQIVAGLSFGFWVAMLDRRYNPALWSAYLRSAFPDLPGTQDRKSLQERLRGISKFRNRIWHHEPIFKDDISFRYSECIETLGWLCRHKVAWIRPECRVMAVLRTKP